MISSSEFGLMVENYLDSINTPYEIRNLIDDDFVLAGGMVLKVITGNYERIPHFEDESDHVKRFIEGLSRISLPDDYEYIESADTDYDFYTNRSKEYIVKYFKRYGYVGKSFIGEQNEYNLEEFVQYSNQYSSRVLRIIKPNTNIKLDIIFTTSFKIFNEDVLIHGKYNDCKNFIRKEFDFNICKIWFNGSVVTSANESIFNDINKRIIRFDFDHDMTINKHKRFTTFRRLLKYIHRGFQFVADETQLEEWSKVYVLSCMNTLFKKGNLSGILDYCNVVIEDNKESIEEDDIKNREHVMNYDAGRTEIETYDMAGEFSVVKSPLMMT